MRRFRVILSTILISMLFAFGVPGLAQDEVDTATCAEARDAAAEVLDSLYTDLETGQAYRVAVPFGAPDDVGTQDAVLDELPMLKNGFEPDNWDTALAQPADNVIFMLFGAVDVVNLSTGAAEELPTVTVTGTASPNLNLRAGPGTDYPVLDALPLSVEAVADGQNEAGDWLRLRRGELTVWGFAEYLDPGEDDLSVLETLEAGDVSRPDLFGAPMLAIELITMPADSVCGEAGLLVQNPNADETGYVEINGVRIALDEGTLLVQGEETEAGMVTTVTVLAGKARVAVPDLPPAEVFTAEQAVVEPDAAPEVTGAEDIDAVVEALPTGLLPVALDEQPVVEPPPPPVVSAPADSTTGTGDTDTDQQPAASFAPTQSSVWQSFPGQDNMSGTCTGPATVFCNHPVAITPNGDGTITWRGQEPTGYVLTPTGPNTFYFSGRRHQGDGNITLALTFTSQTTWSMTMTIVYDNDPNCTHTFYYTAQFQWYK